MVKAKVLFTPPTGPPRIVKVKIKGTKYIQNKKDGKLRGRKAVIKGGETIERNRVAQDFTLVRKSETARGHIRKARKDYSKGQFF